MMAPHLSRKEIREAFDTTEQMHSDKLLLLIWKQSILGNGSILPSEPLTDQGHPWTSIATNYIVTVET